MVPHRAAKAPKISKISDYHFMPELVDDNFNVSTIKLVELLKDMEDKVRWPK